MFVPIPPQPLISSQNHLDRGNNDLSYKQVQDNTDKSEDPKHINEGTSLKSEIDRNSFLSTEKSTSKTSDNSNLNYYKNNIEQFKQKEKNRPLSSMINSVGSVSKLSNQASRTRPIPIPQITQKSPFGSYITDKESNKNIQKTDKEDQTSIYNKIKRLNNTANVNSNQLDLNQQGSEPIVTNRQAAYIDGQLSNNVLNKNYQKNSESVSNDQEFPKQTERIMTTKSNNHNQNSSSNGKAHIMPPNITTPISRGQHNFYTNNSSNQNLSLSSKYSPSPLLNRPPTAPINRVTSASFKPKVEMLMNLMDQTVQVKKEYHRINSIKNTITTGKYDVNQIENPPYSQIGRPNIEDEIIRLKNEADLLKNKLEQKDTKINELENKLANHSNTNNDLIPDVIFKLIKRENEIKNTLKSIDLTTLEQFRNSNTKSMNQDLSRKANDIINQIKLNYKTLKVLLDHLYDKQNITLSISDDYEQEENKNNEHIEPINNDRLIEADSNIPQIEQTLNKPKDELFEDHNYTEEIPKLKEQEYNEIDHNVSHVLSNKQLDEYVLENNNIKSNYEIYEQINHQINHQTVTQMTHETDHDITAELIDHTFNKINLQKKNQLDESINEYTEDHIHPNLPMDQLNINNHPQAPISNLTQSNYDETRYYYSNNYTNIDSVQEEIINPHVSRQYQYDEQEYQQYHMNQENIENNYSEQNSYNITNQNINPQFDTNDQLPPSVMTSHSFEYETNNGYNEIDYILSGNSNFNHQIPEI